jgi:hypothetical protein
MSSSRMTYVVSAKLSFAEYSTNYYVRFEAFTANTDISRVSVELKTNVS